MLIGTAAVSAASDGLDATPVRLRGDNDIARHNNLGSLTPAGSRNGAVALNPVCYTSSLWYTSCAAEQQH